MSEIKNNLPKYIHRNTTQTTKSDNYRIDSFGRKISQTTEGTEPRNYGTTNFSTGAFTRT
jgi:hypothetical protein